MVALGSKRKRKVYMSAARRHRMGLIEPPLPLSDPHLVLGLGLNRS